MTRAATATLFVALAIAGVVVFASRSGSDPKVLPSASATPAIEWVGKLPVSDPPPLTCEAESLTTALGRTGAWHGNATQLVVFRNTGAPCRFPTDLQVTATSATMSTTELPTEPKLLDQTLAAGQSMYLLVGTPACKTLDVTGVTLSVRIGTAAPATLATTGITAACGKPAILDAYSEPIEPATQSLALSATITAPETAHAGTDLSYTIALTNDSGKAITFEECPAYTESLKTAGASLEYQLNCTAGVKLEAGATRTYEMVFAIPPDARGGDLLTWSLSGYRATAHVDIDIEK